MTDYDFSSVPDEAVKELHRQAEICLQGTVQLAIAADQRATTQSGILGAASVALLVASGNLASAQHPNPAFVLSTVVVAFLLFVGALFCGRAARSVDYHVAGYEPKSLVRAAKNEIWMLKCATEDVQRRIDSNRIILEEASKLLTFGRGVAFCAAPLGFAIYWLFSLPS